MFNKMKKVVAGLMLGVMFVTLSGCGKDWTDPKTGKVYETRGFINGKEPGVKYDVSIGNCVWTVLLSGSFVMPFYFVGFSIYNPVGLVETNPPSNVVMNNISTNKKPLN